MESAETPAAHEANRLYWETDLSVGEIARRLDISRRALYDAIRPVPASGHCPACGGELEFTNRSTRAHGFANCRACGQQVTVEAEPAWTWSPPASTTPAATHPTPRPETAWWLGAAALAGALVAAAVTLIVIREE